MSRLILSTLGLGFAVGMGLVAAGCQSNSSARVVTDRTGESAVSTAYDHKPIAENSATLRVNGMSCPKCANNIDLSLAKVPGVTDLNIDLSKGEVKVSFAEGGAHPSRAELARAIEQTGFTLEGISTP